MHEFHVNFLRLVSGVNEHKDVDEVASFDKIIFDHLLPLCFFGFADLCPAIAGKVNQIPGLINQEVIDQLSFSRPSGDLG